MNISATFPDLMRQALDIPNLSPEEETALYNQYKHANSEQGRENAKQRIIAAHLKQCVGIAAKWTRSGVDINDLFGAAQVGLMKAFKKWDPEKGRLSTYAYQWIKEDVRDTVRKNMANIPLGTTSFDKFLFSNYNSAMMRLKTEMPGATTEERHAALADEYIRDNPKAKKPALLKKITEYLAKRSSRASIDAPVSPNSTKTFGEYIESDDPTAAELVEKQSELDHRRRQLGAALDTLKPREREILIARRLSDPPKTLEELSPVYSVSRERIRQIEMRAFEKLQEHMQPKPAERHPETRPKPTVTPAPRPPRIKRQTPEIKPARPAPVPIPQTAQAVEKRQGPPPEYNPKHIGAAHLKAVWDAHISIRGLNKKDKTRDWEWFRRTTLAKKPESKASLAKEFGTAAQTIYRNIGVIEDSLRDIFAKKHRADVIAEAETINEIFATPALLEEVKRRYLKNPPFRQKQAIDRSWECFELYHAQTPNLTQAEIAKLYGIDRSAVSMVLSKAAPKIIALTKEFAREIQQAPLMGGDKQAYTTMTGNPGSAPPRPEPQEHSGEPQEKTHFLQLVRDGFMETGMFRGAENMRRNWEIYKQARFLEPALNEAALATHFDLSTQSIKNILGKMDTTVKEILKDLEAALHEELASRKAAATQNTAERHI